MLKAWIENLLKDKLDRVKVEMMQYVELRLNQQRNDERDGRRLPVLEYEHVAAISKAREQLEKPPKKSRKVEGGWTQKSHERKGHYRTLKSGKRVWVKGSKIHP